MIVRILKIRLIQLKREIIKLGFLYTLFSILLLLLGGFILYNQFNSYPNVLFVLAIITVVVSTIHIDRKDKRFIAKITTKPKSIFLIEYLFFSIPVFILLILSKYWFFSILLIFGYCSLIFIKYNRLPKVGIINYSKFIPSSNFEWIAGFRKYFWRIAIIYLLAV